MAVAGKPNVGLAGRIKQIRREQFGEQGGPALAARLGVSARRWMEVEAGGELPGSLFLRFLDVTGTDPLWLLTGEGRPYLNDRRNDGATRRA